MSDFEFHPVVLATDTTDLQAGTVTRVTDALGKGLTSAAISGALSIYNTFQDYTGGQQADYEETVRRFGGNEMGDYYAENKDTIDMVGFVGTSLIPGSIGMKGLQLARSGTALGNFGKALNLTASRKNEYLRKALQETAEGGGAIKSILSRNRLGQLAWESADQAMLGTAFELGVLATMNDSPIFDDYTVKDFAWNVGLGTALSGAIGGPLGSLAARGILKSAEREINAQMRLADIVFNPEKLGMTKGTEALVMAESIARLPETFTNLPFRYKVDGKMQEIELNTAEAMAGARMSAEKLGKDQLALKFNELAQGDAVRGQAVFDFMQRATVAAREAGRSPTDTIELLNGYLNNVKAVRAIDLERMELDARKFYVRTKPFGKEATPFERVTGLFSPKRTRETTQQPYMLADDVVPTDLQIEAFEALNAKSIKEAFRLNPELDMIQKIDGTYAINPYSARIKRVRENPVEYRMFVDLEHGGLSTEAVPRFGDILRRDKLRFSDDSIEANSKNRFKQVPSRASQLADSPLESSARFAWASQLNSSAVRHIIKDVLDTADLPMLTRLSELIATKQISDDSLRKITFKEGNKTRTFDDIPNFNTYVEQRKVDWLADQLNAWGSAKGSVPDARILATHINASQDWVEDVIANGFKPANNKPFAGRLLPSDAALAPNTVEFVWDFGAVPRMLPEEAYKMNMGPSHLATQELTREYQLRIRKDVNSRAADTVLGADAAMFLAADDLLHEGESSLARAASTEGAGATALGAANAGYGERLRLWAQDTGKNIALLTQRLRDEAVETLAPAINRLRESPQASAELGILTNALRKSPYRFTFHPDDPMTLVSTEATRLARNQGTTVDEALEYLADVVGDGTQHSFKITDAGVQEFLLTHSRINAARQEKMTVLYNATGLTRKPAGDLLVYVPPINTVKYPYHAFVRTKQKLGLASDTGMIVARNEEQLRKIAEGLGNDFDIFYKADTDAYFRIKGEYDYQMSLNESRVNSELSRRGALAEIAPETRFENIAEDYLQFHAKSVEKFVRTAVQVKNRQTFSELKFLSDQYRKVSESVVRGIGSRFKSKIADPFDDFIKTSLNISKQQEFPLLDSLNEFVDKVSIQAGEALSKAYGDARKGLISWEEANKVSDSFGLGKPYRNEELYLAVNETYPRNILREGLQKANLALANMVLRLDFANSMINMISTPIMLGTELSSIKQLIRNDSVLAGKLRELTTVAVPGREGLRVPSTTKLLANGINNYFGAEKATLIARYKEIGAIKDVSQLYHEVLDDLSFRPAISPRAWLDKINNGIERGAKFTGNVLSEEVTRFVSADVMRQLSQPLVDAGKMTIKEQNAYISTFVNRVQGNYVTSQRPIIFQGTTGAAISLFQTYAFNVLQQLHRHIQAGDKRTLAVFAGLQGTIFGLNGLPFFDAVNTHLIGGAMAGNPQHKDAYSVLPAFNKELGDWMLYGTASALPLFAGDSPALFTRGDINPRHLTIVPVSPLDVPAVSAGIKLVDAVVGMGKDIVQGVDASDALLSGLEHQGWNRPLAGLAQLLAGQSTTSKGSLISAANEMQNASWLGALAERTFSVEGVSRLMGARPMDEAVALNAIYRQKTYDAMDRARIERLGEIVKTKLRGDEVPTDEELDDFMLRYTRSGGRVENFNRAMQQWSRDASVSVVNQMAAKMGTPYAEKLRSIMGGEMLEDYRYTEE